MKKLAMVGLVAALSTGCATQTYLLSEGGQTAPSADKWQHFFVGGIGQEVVENAAEVCGGAHKVAKIETQQSFLNGLASFVSNGLYTPHQNKVYCK